MQVEEIERVDPELISRLAELEAKAFGDGGLNEWTLPVFIRYGRVFILKDKDEILGIAQLIRDWNDQKTAFLVGISLKSSKRGRGLGNFFFRTILARLLADGIERVKLTVSPENHAARRLYEGLGFKDSAWLKDEYGVGVDRALMSLDLTELI